MPQIPLSVSGLFSLSSERLVGPFGRLVVGARFAVSLVLSSLSVEGPKSALRPSQTIEFRPPTKCFLASGPVPFPYVAAMGYATVVLVSHFCILHAKGFSSASCSSYPYSMYPYHPTSPEILPPIPDNPIPADSHTRVLTPIQNHDEVDAQTSSPSPELGSSFPADDVPPHNGWLWILLLVLYPLALAAIYVYLTTGDSTPPEVPSTFTLASIEGLSRIEMGLICSVTTALSYVSTIKIFINLHGWQYCKTFLLALASYSGLIVIAHGLSRLRTSIAATLSILDPLRVLVHLFCAFGPLVVIGSTTYLSWIFWLPFRLERVSVLPNFGRWLSWVENGTLFSSAEKLMIIGPTIIQAVFMGIPTTCAVLCQTGIYTTRALRLHRRRMVIGLIRPIAGIYAFNIVADAATVLIILRSSLYDALPPNLKYLLWKYPFLCRRWRTVVRRAFWFIAWDYRVWKEQTIRSLENLLTTTFDFCLETWGALCFVQKLLIVAPTAIYYGYFYLIPAARRLPAFFRRWRRRYPPDFSSLSPA
ncbi:hypothetical protein DFH07DRAFT_796812 [Mycena maculata]|uniref:Uncharacterized protein n=1 Tax=Mycena maculata TaxID=230809 RepID=A0AAD7K4G7_9AGAR|nr:hypothetical protein DFH07DRAFT_796812 [Mycena maculata]